MNRRSTPMVQLEAYELIKQSAENLIGAEFGAERRDHVNTENYPKIY